MRSESPEIEIREVLDALEQALYDRKPSDGLVHHSDRGSQYLSIRYSERLAEAGIEPSVGSKGDSYDNALDEATQLTLHALHLPHDLSPVEFVREVARNLRHAIHGGGSEADTEASGGAGHDGFLLKRLRVCPPTDRTEGLPLLPPNAGNPARSVGAT